MASLGVVTCVVIFAVLELDEGNHIVLIAREGHSLLVQVIPVRAISPVHTQHIYTTTYDTRTRTQLNASSSSEYSQGGPPRGPLHD